MMFEFPVGSGNGVSSCISVSISEDLLVEGNEIFSVKLMLDTESRGVTLGNAETTVTIIDEDSQFSHH